MVRGGDRIERPAQADVVGDAAVGEMDVRPRRSAATLPLHHLGEREPVLRSRGAARIHARGVVLRREPHPLGVAVAAAAGVVLERERGKAARERRRRGGGSRERHAREVGAHQVELVLDERELGAGGHVGGVEDHERPAVARDQLGVGGAAEHLAVIELRREVAAPVGRRRELEPARRRERELQQIALQRPVEEAVRKLIEDPAPAQRVVRRRKAAARDRGDHVDLVEQREPAPVPLDAGVAQRLEHAVRERRGARPAAGKGDDDEKPVAVVAALQPLEAIARVRLVLRERRIGRRKRRARRQQRARDDGEGAHDQSSFR